MVEKAVAYLKNWGKSHVQRDNHSAGVDKLIKVHASLLALSWVASRKNDISTHYHGEHMGERTAGRRRVWCMVALGVHSVVCCCIVWNIEVLISPYILLRRPIESLTFLYQPLSVQGHGRLQLQWVETISNPSHAYNVSECCYWQFADKNMDFGLTMTAVKLLQSSKPTLIHLFLYSAF